MHGHAERAMIGSRCRQVLPGARGLRYQIMRMADLYRAHNREKQHAEQGNPTQLVGLLLELADGLDQVAHLVQNGSEARML